MQVLKDDDPVPEGWYVTEEGWDAGTPCEWEVFGAPMDGAEFTGKRLTRPRTVLDDCLR